MKAEITADLALKIAEAGKGYIPRQVPKDVPRMPFGKCFDNCALLAWQSKGKYRYVEGIAIPLDDPVPVLHAWLIDENDRAIDPTWAVLDQNNNPVNKSIMPALYIGFEIPIDGVLNFMRTTEHQGLIANSFRAPEIVAKLIPELA